MTFLQKMDKHPKKDYVIDASEVNEIGPTNGALLRVTAAAQRDGAAIKGAVTLRERSGPFATLRAGSERSEGRILALVRFCKYRDASLRSA